jgi:NADH:ubiquinone oxidoreductase subunit D
MFNNFAYCLAVEKLLGLEVPCRASYIRVILAELNRIASHLVWMGTQALDIGAWTPLLYCFRDREKILDIFELYCGARLTFSCFRIGGVFADLPPGFIEKVHQFTETFLDKLRDSEALLTNNEIWLRRTRGIGVISKEDALGFGVSGPVLRGSGIEQDVRKAAPYAVYDKLNLDVPCGKRGDVYDRYLVRVEEMKESTRIVRQAIEGLPEGRFIADAARFVFPERERVKDSIEALIFNFHLAVEGFPVPAGEAYAAVESPRGELGFYIVSEGGTKPYRLKIRSPAYSNVQILSKLLPGMMVADAVATIASLDPVLGEIDR